MATPRPVLSFLTRIPGLIESFTKRCPDVQTLVIPVSSSGQLGEETLSLLQEAVTLVVDPDLLVASGLAQQLPRLQWIQSTFAGQDAFFSSLDPKLPMPGYTLTRFGGSFGPHMAEYVLGHIIAHERQFATMRKNQEASSWTKESVRSYRLLSQLTLGILGLGDIGKEVARASKAMGMRVVGVGRRQLSPEHIPPNVDEYRHISQLAYILEESDYIVSILPSTPQTKQLLTEDLLKHCKTKKSVFINVGRGDVTTENTIITALNQGWLRHAILDVFPTEPLPETSPLWRHPQVTITPHVSAMSFGYQVAELAAKNYQKYVKGEPLEFVVDWTTGY